MPWFRSKVLTACAWAAPVLAAVLPHSHGRAARAEDLLHLGMPLSYTTTAIAIRLLPYLGSC